MNFKRFFLFSLIFHFLCINVFAAEVEEPKYQDDLKSESKSNRNYYVIQKKKDIVPIILATTLFSSLSVLGLNVLYDQTIVKKRLNKTNISEIDKILNGIRNGEPQLFENLLKVAIKTVNNIENEAPNT